MRLLVRKKLLAQEDQVLPDGILYIIILKILPQTLKLMYIHMYLQFLYSLPLLKIKSFFHNHYKKRVSLYNWGL